MNSFDRPRISRRKMSRSGMKTSDDELCTTKEMAAIKIQSWARGSSCRRAISLLEESLAAAIINTCVRSCMSRKKMNRSEMESHTNELCTIEEIVADDDLQDDTFIQSILLVQRLF